MRLRDVAGVVLLLAVAVQPLSSQGIRDRLKKVGITVSSGKDTSKGGAKADPAAKATASKIPVSSSAHPEVNGLIAGTSTLADVRALFAKATPAMMTAERKAILSSKPASARTGTDVPGTEYVEILTAVTKDYVTNPRGPDVAYNNCAKTLTRGNCDQTRVDFSAYPGPNVVVSVDRQVRMPTPPLADNVEKAMTEKYGKPSARQDGGRRTLYWFYAPDGSVIQNMPPDHPCAKQVANQYGYTGSNATFGGTSIREATALLEGGCAAVLYVTFEHPNELVHSMTYRVFDAFALYTGQAKAAEVIAAFETKQREDAAKVKIP